MIIAVFGSKCSGKTTFARYLETKYGFIVYDSDNIKEQTDQFNINSSDSIKMMSMLKLNEKSNEKPTTNEILLINSEKEELKDTEIKEIIINQEIKLNTPIKVKPESANKFLESPVKNSHSGKKSKSEVLNQDIKQLTLNTPGKKIVILNLNDEDVKDLSRKSFFRLIEVSAHCLDRFTYYKNKYDKNCEAETFLKLDKIYSSKPISLNPDLKILNDSTQETFYYKIDRMFNEYNICDRLKWIDYFMKVAEMISNRSNCIKQKVGAIIVKEFKIISSGYNGKASGLKNCYEGGCKRCFSEAKQGENMGDCVCLHAEQNALLEIGKKESSGATLYTTCFPCDSCASMIVQSKIKKVIYDREYKCSLAREILLEAGIEIVKYEKMKNVI